MYGCARCVYSTHRGQERVSDSLGQGSQMAVRCCVSVLGIELGFYKECSFGPQTVARAPEFVYGDKRYYRDVPKGVRVYFR